MVLETTVRGSFAVLRWYCETCTHEWPVTSEEEQIDRRLGPAERRTKPRADRRAK